jgi:tRNA-2-methylthio-N6-dimethylallyladenosine synthase
MKSFYIETFGCQMNVHDSERVAGTLVARGYRRVETPEEADLVVYNTCSVRDKAEQKVYNRLSQFKRTGNGKLFAVLGCVAQQAGEAIFEKAPHVSLVCGSASYNKLPELLTQIEAGGRRVTGLDLGARETYETPFATRNSRHHAYITIIEGCDKSCSYCVVPFTRGGERSRASNVILEDVQRLADDGYTEVQLLGQNVNSYRDPSPAGCDFAALLARVGEVRGLRRVRFATSHPRDFGKEIVDAIDANPVLCNSIHLPVQSGSSRVLDRMRRQYSRDEYMQRIEWIKGARRDIAISTDIIAGFPGETNEDFEETMSLLRAVEYDSIFSFKYSPRPNTLALEFREEVPDEEKGRRLTALQELQRSIQLKRNTRLVGTVDEVLVEGHNTATGQWIGRTSQNRVLNFVHGGDEDTLVGEYVQVRVNRAGPNSLAGESVI